MKRKPVRHILQWKPLALAVAMAFQPAQGYAQVAPASGGPAVSNALNGVPIVNIVAPNGAGLSHNKYIQFNVDNRGLVLNNATQAGVSQLGGAVLANPNLASSARIILNEVVAPNRSMLNGFTEVYGLPADVVLANPSGITCNGCGFINTPRATLTTGTPNIDAAGNLTGFAVRGGDISVTGTGLDATGQTYFDILARAVSVTGQINARDLNVVAGSNDYDYASRTATPASASGAAPVLAIDSSLLGGMYADRIRLIATENGVGVRLLGDVGASVDDVMLTAAGRIQLQGRLTAQRDLAISYTGGAAANAIMAGAGTVVVAGQDLTMNGGTGGGTFTGGTIGANRNASFTLASLADSGAGSDLRFAGGLLSLTSTGAASVNGPNWNGSGGLAINAASLSVGAGGAGFFAASGGNPSGAVSIHTAGNLALGSGAVSGTTANLQSDSGTLSIGAGGAVEATGAVNLNVGTGFSNAGTVSAGGDLMFSTGITSGTLALNNLAGGRLEAGGALNASFSSPLAVSLNTQAGSTLIGDTLAINVATVDNAGKLQGTHGSTIVADTFTNQTTGLAVLSATAGSNGTLTANSVTNLGSARSGGVATAGITSSGGMTIDVADPFTNAGNLVAAQDLTLRSSSIENGSLIQAGGTLALQGAGGGSNLSLTNNAGATLLGNQLSINANTVTNAGTMEGVAGSTISVADDFINQAGGIVTLARNSNASGSITAANLIKNAGTIQSFGGMTLGATAANNEWALTNTGTLAAAGDMTLQLSGGAISLRNENMIAAGGLLQVNVSGSGTIDNGFTGSVMRGGTVNIAAPNSVLFNAGKLFSTGSMTSNSLWVFNRPTGAIFAQQNLSLTTANGDIENDAGAVILSGGSMALTSQSGGILNLMAYGSGAGGDSVGIIRSGGALSISAPNGVLTNNGWIDSNSGNVTISAIRVDNVSFAPPVGTSTGVVTLIADTLANVGTDNLFAGTVFPKITLRQQVAQRLSAVSEFTMFTDAACFGLCQLGGGNAQAYFLWTNDGSAPRQPGGTWLYRDFTALAHSGAQYTRTPVQARIVANGGSMTVNAPVNLVGAEMRARDNLTITGDVDLTPIALSGQSVWNVKGQDRWLCLLASCAGVSRSTLNSIPGGTFPLRDFVNYQYDGQYRVDGLNGSGNYTLTALDPLHPTGSMVTMGAFLGTSGGQRSSTSGTTNPSGLTINGSVTTHNPADLIPGLSALAVSAIAPVTPVVASAGPGGTTTGAQPASALIAAGVNVSLPTNPNGLFVVNPNPSAKYLVELNPLYTSLENILFGSDYLVDKLGLNPDAVMQRLGDKSYEAELITQQLARQTGRSLIAGAADVNQQLERLFDNAAWESKELNLSFGVALSPNQLNALKQDMVWMVETVVNGHQVLAPVVYLSSATRASVVGGTQIVADSLAVTGSSFINNGGTVDVTRALSIRTTGDIVNTAGTISGGNVSLVSDTGNIRNSAVVSRLGDTENYRDVIDRGTIRSTGTLNIAATTGSVANSGSQIASGGNASISAGRDITFEAVVLESRSVTEKSSTAGLFGTQKSSTKITTTDQQSVGGNVTSGGNLTLNAGRDVTLVGSQAGARGNLTVDAEKVNVLNATTTSTKVTEKSESGLGVSLTGGGGSANLSMGYGTSNSTTTQTNVNVISSGLTSGGNTNITGRQSVTVRGSDVKSGGDLTVNTNALKTEAAQQTTTIDSSGRTTGGGLYAGGSGNSASGGWQGSNTDSTSHSFESNARSSTLSSGGNMALGNAAGSGTIAHQGTQIEAGGNFEQRAATISFTAAENRRETTSSSTTAGGQTGVGVTYNAQQGYEQAKGGGVPDAAAPSFQGTLGGTYGTDSGNMTSTQGVAGSIKAGGNVTSTSSGKTTLEGTNIQGGGNVTLNAGSLEYNAATSTRQSSSDGMTTGGSASLGVDATGSVTGGASGNYGTSNSTGSATSQRAGSIVAGGNTTINTTGDATFQGTNLNTRGNTTISAGGKVDYQAAVSTISSSSSSENMSGGIDGSKTGKGGDSTKSGTMSGSYDNSSGSQTARIERGGSIVSGGNVTISAGTTSDLSMTGTDIAAGGNVGLSAGRNVDLRAAESSVSSSNSSFSAGGSLGKETKNDKTGDKGGSSGSASMSSENSSGYAVSQQGALITGRNVTIGAGNNLSMQGTVVGAQDTATLNAGGKLDMQSAQDRSASTSSNSSFSIGGSTGEGSGGHVGGAVGGSRNENVVNRNAIVSGNNVSVTTGGDATLRGANIAGNNVSTQVGGNLAIESRADVSRAANSQVGGYLGGATITNDFSTNSIVSQRGELAKSGVGLNSSSSNTNTVGVTMQSGITGERSNTVAVTGNTALTGARIGSDSGGSVSVTTSRLTQAGVEQSSETAGSGFGFSAQLGNWQAPTTSAAAGRNSASTLASSVQGTVTQTAPGAAPVAIAPSTPAPAAGQTTVQPTVNLAQLGAVLNQPAVQTALRLNKGMKAAAEQYGGTDNVPADTVRRILDDAGVAVPAGSTDRMVRTLLNSTLDSAYSAAITQLGATNIPASQAGSILKAIIP